MEVMTLLGRITREEFHFAYIFDFMQLVLKCSHESETNTYVNFIDKSTSKIMWKSGYRSLASDQKCEAPFFMSFTSTATTEVWGVCLTSLATTDGQGV